MYMYMYVCLILEHCVKVSHPCRSAVDNQPLSQLISRLIADFLFSVVMEALFLFQVRDGNSLVWLVKSVIDDSMHVHGNHESAY